MSKVTSKDVGKKFTYDGQVIKVMHVKGGTIGVGKNRRRMTVKRLELLLDDGRAVWGNLRKLDQAVDCIVRATGGSVCGEDNATE